MKVYHSIIVEALISLYDKKVTDLEFDEELQDAIQSLKNAGYRKTAHEVEKAKDLAELLGREKERESIKTALEHSLRSLSKEAEGMS